MAESAPKRAKVAEDFDEELVRAVVHTERAVLDDKWITDFLVRSPVCTVATAAADGQPYVHPRNFAYDSTSHSILLHGGPKGRFWDHVLDNPKVCVNVAEMGKIKQPRPDQNESAFGVEFSSATIFGKVEVVDDPEEKLLCLRRITDHYSGGKKRGTDFKPLEISDAPDIKRTVVYRIKIDGWSGKKTGPVNDEGAVPFVPPVM